MYSSTHPLQHQQIHVLTQHLLTKLKQIFSSTLFFFMFFCLPLLSLFTPGTINGKICFLRILIFPGFILNWLFSNIQRRCSLTPLIISYLVLTWLLSLVRSRQGLPCPLSLAVILPSSRADLIIGLISDI